MHTGIYLGGEWRQGSDNEVLAVQDPSNEEIIAEVSAASEADAIAAVDCAEQAGKDWAKRAPRERAEVLRKAFELLIANSDEIAELIVRENGKCLRDARGETAYAAEFFRWYAEEAVRNVGDLYIAPSGANRIVVQSQPVGVSVLVTPWNFPAAMATRKIAPALAAGCSVILKPASETPLTALAIAAYLEQAGVPPGVVNVLPSNHSGRMVAAMLADPRVRKLSFTGSTEVGRILLAEAAKTVVNCSMELGGNAPFLVCADADVDAAVEGAMIAKMRNGGEACTAANRFYVHDAVMDEFSDKFTAKMQALKIGPGLDPDVDLGPLINQKARQDVHALVTDAVDKGASTLTGGEAVGDKGYFYAATVLLEVPETAELLREEIFGPVAPLVGFSDEDHAIAMANQTQYGLIAYLYTEDLRKGMAMAERLDAGMIGLNRGLVSDPAAPFGGTKQSGIGREGAHDGMLEFLEKKYIAVAW
ncbi:MAG: NAD-dependent succinate-semialdehyde dehydrogenase [Proteobacteria bacterium]|nr:NAD-dependent succinate-semialdehyde dehydrogenase [Pseudomonadota bacterium]